LDGFALTIQANRAKFAAVMSHWTGKDACQMATDDRPVALLGAGGRTGGAIIAALASQGLQVRLLRRSPMDSSELPANVQTCRADLANVRELTEALAGCSQVYYIPPALDPQDEQYARNLIAAMQAAGLARITYHSVLHAATPTLPHHARKARVEHIFRASELVWTILQPAMYSQSTLLFFDAATRHLAPAFNVASRFTPIDLLDLADAAAKVLMQDGHELATYELAGSQVLSFKEMGAELSAALGQPVQVEQADRAGAIEAAGQANGFTGEALSEFGLMLDHYDKHGLAGNSNVLGWILGRPPATYRDMLDRTFG
jgi:uncharacterized protein YbjT (DUF2867 family)